LSIRQGSAKRFDGFFCWDNIGEIDSTQQTGVNEPKEADVHDSGFRSGNHFGEPRNDEGMLVGIGRMGVDGLFGERR
jgi:hypothetical protein